MSKCQRFYEIVSVSVDCEANPLEQLALQEHIKSCNICKNELTLQYTLKDMMRSYQTPTDIDVSANVMRKIRYLQTENMPDMAKIPQTSRFSHRLMAACLMFVFTTTGLFLGNGAIGENMVYTNNPDPAKTYAAYIYQHLNDDDSAYVSERGSVDFKHVSSIR